MILIHDLGSTTSILIKAKHELTLDAGWYSTRDGLPQDHVIYATCMEAVAQSQVAEMALCHGGSTGVVVIFIHTP